MRAPAKPRQTATAATAKPKPPAIAATAKPKPSARKPARTTEKPAAPNRSVTTTEKPGAAVVGGSPAGRVSGQFAERVAERRSARRRLRWRTMALIGVGVLVVAALGWLVLYSPVLALDEDEITITGTTEIVTDAQVREVVRAQVGVPLARLDTGATAEGVEGLTGVLDVRVSRVWPTGLEVAVEPRIPVASVAADGGGFALLDADGVQLAHTEAPTEALPVITVPLGQENTAASLEAVLTVLSQLPPDVLAQVADAGAQTPNQVRFVLTDGAEVIWGSAEDGELKVAVLTTLRTVPAAVYDISAPLSPITRD